ncbi:hypothetical protein [Phocaeicola coprophilus]|jgi:hypothetical protein
MNFKSQIATNINQSWKLLNLGLKPCTADMYLEKSKTPEYGEYHLHTICEGIDPEHWFSVRMNRDITPAWSLDRLLELIPKSIKQRHRPNADFDMHSDGQYWFISYEELGYDVKHQEMRHKSFDAVICMIEWLIHNNHLNKEYLKERL